MHLFKLDLHSHEPNFIHLSFSKNTDKKNISDFLKKAFNIRGDAVIGIANSNDNGRYERFVNGINSLKEYNANLTNKDTFVSLTKGKKTIHFVKADEIGTNKGHILIIGHNGKIGKLKLKPLLELAYNEGDIIIANHPLHNFGISHFLVKKYFEHNHPISFTKRELKKDEKYLDAVELNSYFPEDWKKIKKFSRKEKIPLVADSDAHFLREFFSSYFELENLDFSNSINFKKSLKSALKTHIRLHLGKNGFLATYEHALQIIWYKIGFKLGFLKE